MKLLRNGNRRRPCRPRRSSSAAAPHGPHVPGAVLCTFLEAERRREYVAVVEEDDPRNIPTGVGVGRCRRRPVVPSYHCGPEDWIQRRVDPSVVEDALEFFHIWDSPVAVSGEPSSTFR